MLKHKGHIARDTRYACWQRLGTRGFTARELVIVLALVVVIIIAIPMIQTVSKDSENAGICLHRRTIAAHVLNYAYQVQGSDLTDADIADAIKSAGGDDACPAGGTLYVAIDEETGLPHVRCTVHTKDDAIADGSNTENVTE